MRPTKVVEDLPPSGIRAFFDLVMRMKDVVSLGVGEPDFPTPWNIRESAIYALEEGNTTYTSNKGLFELRHDISAFLKHKQNLEYDPEEEILVTVGTSEALDLAVRALVNPGDKVLIPEPCYVSYNPLVILAGGRPVPIKTSAEDGFKVRPKDIIKSCDKHTKFIVLNYPSNPTGASYTRRELLEIKKAILSRRLTVISDEIYGELTYDFSHTAFASLAGAREHTIYLNGFSKAYAMTGWRLGYACGPKEAIAAMTKIHQYTMLSAPTVSQIAGREALKNGERSVHEMRREYKRRRDYIVGELNNMGLKCHTPEGAFYVFPSVKSTGMTSMDFSNRLLKAEKVAVVPGTAFGPSGEGYIRISYAYSMDSLKEAIGRIKSFLKTV
jgi:aminotransferase